MIEKINETVLYLERKIMYRPKLAIILGSGLNEIEKLLNNKTIVDYEDIPNFPVSTVEGHKGRFVIGTINGKEILLMQGRFHYYEGYSMDEVTYPIYVLKSFGIKNIIVTNAAGGINQKFSVGDFMIIEDHINHFGTSPLIGKNDSDIGPRFVDLTEPYSNNLIEVAERAASELSIPYQKGVYIGVSGPCYETKAEIRYYEKIGADAVGMSTVPEVIVANYLKLNVLGISFISNMGTGIAQTKHSHENVLKTAEENMGKLTNWLQEIIMKIGQGV